MLELERNVIEVNAIPSVRERYFSSIGRFVVAFSALEGQIKALIAEAAGIEESLQPALLNQDFVQACNIAQKVAPLRRSPDSAAKLSKILSACKKVNEERVKIVHGWWVVGGDRMGGFLQHTSRQKIMIEYLFDDPTDIAKLADQIYSQLCADLWRWQLAFPRSHPPAPDLR